MVINAIASPAAAHGRAGGEALVATYGPERRPHAREFIALAVEVGKVIQVIDPAEAEARDRRLKAQGLRFAFPAPQLGPGAHRAGELGGRLAPQGILPDGSWHDDRVGHRFSLLLDRRLACEAAAALAALCRQYDMVLISDPGDRMQAWLEKQAAAAVLVRPDRYVFDACERLEQAGEMMGGLSRWLATGR